MKDKHPENSDKSQRAFWLLALMLLLPQLIWGQLTIRGSVTTGDKQEPLPFADVFLSGTTKGTRTDANGLFMLSNVPPGTFDLIVSFVGFTTLKTTIKTQEVKTYRFILKLLDNELNSVTVRARRRRQDWSKQLALFTDNFVGITANASLCRLLNPSILQFEDTPSTLTATAQEPIIIENKALGYRITYHLEKFSYEYDTQRISYQGYPVFEDLTPKDEKQADEWREHREMAYAGSVMHFMRALYRKKLIQEGFVIQQIIEKKNRNGERRFVGLPGDTLVYFPSLTHSNKQVAYPMVSYKKILDTLLSNPDQPVIAFPGWLQVIYARKREPASYQRFRETPENKYTIIPQRSFIRMLQPSVPIEINGRFDLQGIFFEGYWTWELMAESLPIDYEPKKM